MATKDTVHGDLLVQGSITMTGTNFKVPTGATLSGGTESGFFPRSALVTDPLSVYPIPFTAMRVHDDFSSLLPGVAANDDLGLTDSNWTGSGTAHTLTGVVTSADVQTQYAAFIFPLPVEYVAAGGATIRIRAKTSATPGGSGAATIEAQAYLWATPGVTGANIVVGGAQNLATSATNYDFSLTATGLSAGSVLAVRIVSIADDNANQQVLTNTIYNAAMLLDVKG